MPQFQAEDRWFSRRRKTSASLLSMILGTMLGLSATYSSIGTAIADLVGTVSTPSVTVSHCLQSHHNIRFMIDVTGFPPNTYISIEEYQPQNLLTGTRLVTTNSSGAYSNSAGFGSSEEIKDGIWKVKVFVSNPDGSKVIGAAEASTTFTVPCQFNRIPPETTIASAVDDSGNQIRNGTTISSTFVKFTFVISSNFGNTAKFECNLDGGLFSDCTMPCNTPNCIPNTFTSGEIQYSHLKEGTHTFQVRSIDDSDNVDPTPAVFTWIIGDSTTPDTTITSAIDGNNKAITNGGSTLYPSIQITFSGTDNVAVAGFQCSLDGQGASSCISPVTYNNLAIGTHTFQVRAIDTSNNVDPIPASFSWRIVTPSQYTKQLTQNLLNGGVTNGGIVQFIQGIQQLIQFIQHMALRTDVATNLATPLNQAMFVLSDNNPVNDAAACNYLSIFSSQVNTMQHNAQLNSQQGSILVQLTQLIKAKSGCLS